MGGRFARVGHHEDSLFAGRGIGPRIGKWPFVYNLVRVFVLILDVEILDQSVAVMGENKVANDDRKVVFFGQFNAIVDVSKS